jgi:hypothetical protein
VTILILVSLPLAVLAYFRPRWWVLLVPYVAWAGFVVLEDLGLLPGASSPGAVVLAATLGAVCAAVGVLLGRTRQLRGVKPD